MDEYFDFTVARYLFELKNQFHEPNFKFNCEITFQDQGLYCFSLDSILSNHLRKS